MKAEFQDAALQNRIAKEYNAWLKQRLKFWQAAN